MSKTEYVFVTVAVWILFAWCFWAVAYGIYRILAWLGQ